ncbi:MAG: Hpt domain-containing protein, partial [Azoarcus sp.]|nr:Hpt domain-containing protein [Azoarcus sp.]
MTHANEPDLGPLTWVKPEIEQALSHAVDSLQAALGSADGSARIQFAQNHLHQARGALSFIGLDGLTIFVDALDLFLSALARGELQLGEAQVALGRRAFASIANYLEELVHGTPDQPLRLLPLYRELVLARGETDPSPADLFFPDLSARIPPREETPKPGAAQNQQQRRSMRLRFQRGLLDWLRRSDAAGIDAMRTALAGLEATEDNYSGMRSLWWAGQAFVDTLSASSSDEQSSAKHLLTRIESQLHRIEDSTQALPERLLRELLYHIASRPASTPIQQAARQVWQLDTLIPEEGSVVSDLPIGPLLQELRSQFTRIKDEWNLIGEHGTTALSQFVVQLEAFTKSTTPLGRPVLYRLLSGMCRFIAWLDANPQRYSESIALEFATALLLTEASLDHGLPDPGFQTQVGDALSRLEALARGEELSAPPSATSVESARKQQEKEAIAQVSREILSSLATIEQTLDDFFRDHAKRAPLETLHLPLHQIEGALSLLGENDAISLVRESGEIVARLAKQDSPVDDAELTELAQRFSALGFFVKSLPYKRTSVSHFLHSATAPAQQKPSGIDLPESPEISAIPVSTEPRAKARSGPADGIESFPAFEVEVEGVAEIEVSLPPKKSATAPSATESRVPSPKPPQVELDAEVLPIFIEEAREWLQKIIECLKSLRASPGDHDSLTEIRRGFHTLKGSGRMAGLTDLGDAAWGIEQTLNRWLQLEWQVNPPLLKMLAIAHREFTAWVNQIDEKAKYHRDVPALLAEAERLRDNAPSAAESAPVTAPKIAEQEVEVSEIEVSEIEEPETEAPDSAATQLIPEETTHEFDDDIVVLIDEPETLETEEPDFATTQIIPEGTTYEFVDDDDVVVLIDEPEAIDEETRIETADPETPPPEAAKPAAPGKTKRPVVPKFEPFDFSPFTFDFDDVSSFGHQEFNPEESDIGNFEAELSGSAPPEADQTSPARDEPFETGFVPASDSDTLYIGDVEISRALFELYVAEAQTHINTLHQEFNHLADNPTLLLPE